MQSTQSLEAFLQGWPKEGLSANYVCLAGTEMPQSFPGRKRLFFCETADDRLLGAEMAGLPLGDVISGGVYRNSFYHHVWTEHTSVRRIFIALRGSGTVALVVAQSAVGREPSSVLSCEVSLSAGKPQYIRLPDLGTYWPEGRLYWDLRALSHDAEVASLEFVTDQRPVNRARTAVLIRTFGRTSDVARLLESFADQKATEKHRHFLQQTKFVVLDTTPDALPQYERLLTSGALNLAVLDGENLGGGGNAAQILFRVLGGPAAESIDEIIMTDDDLEISLESLARYHAFTQFRTKDLISTCPVLMKSEPQVIWEDGGYWGRFHPDKMSSQRVGLFPRLLKHGWRLAGFAYLDDLAVATNPEYATFIFFAAPKSVFQKLGYPAAFFLRGDDIEYSLRAREMGIKMISNPNLCAWHEPGHAYGQEYMAILHGLLVNFSYGTVKKSDFVEFFNGRLLAHGSYRDGVGLSVYVKVLEALVTPTPLLTRDFASLYLKVLKELKSLEKYFEAVPRSAVDDLLRKLDGRGKLVPFVHMPVSTSQDWDVVVFENVPQKTFYFRHASDSAADELYLTVVAQFSTLLAQFSERFDEIVNEFGARLTATREESFWQPLFADKPFTLKQSMAASGGTAAPSPKIFLKKPTRRRPGRAPLLDLVRKAVPSNATAGALPDGFDERTYLHLNPDVAEAGMSARAHYLKHGRAEGRSWKREESV